MKLGIAALLRPEIEWNRGEFIDQGNGQTVLAQVNRLDISVACIAAFHPDIRKLFGSINRKFGMVFFVAAGADDAAELPLTQAESTKQIAPRSLAQRTKHSHHRLAAAEGAQRISIVLKL